MMKLAGVALIAFAAVSLDPRPAAACLPEPRCADVFCRGSVAILEARVQDYVEDAELGVQRVTLQIISAHGDAGELDAGAYVTFDVPPHTVVYGHIGFPIVVFADRDQATGGLAFGSWIPRDNNYERDACFGAGGSVDELASAALSDACYETLDRPVTTSSPGTACVATFGCAATTPSGALAPIVVALGWLGFAGARRRRRP